MKLDQADTFKISVISSLPRRVKATQGSKTTTTAPLIISIFLFFMNSISKTSQSLSMFKTYTDLMIQLIQNLHKLEVT